MNEVPADHAAGVILPPRPYPGLRPFRTAEWPIFFGRERMTDEVMSRLVRQRMIFLHGDSGSGKSSLLRAGVLARLEQGELGEGWHTAACLPREAPLWNMAVALALLAGDGEDEASVLDWRRALNSGAGAAEAVGVLREARGAGPGCLLLDQFEELFQHARLYGRDEAVLLTQALTSLHDAPPAGLYIAVTMRSEFLGACARFSGFAELVNATQYLLPRMGHEDMLRAIREPALLYDGQVSRELAERLIADTGGNQDQLPLIQHGLMRLYLRQPRAAGAPWQLGIADYPAERGLAGMLSDHADEVARRVTAALGPGYERLVEDMFRALTEVNADGQAIRRPQTLAQLARVIGVSPEVLDRAIEAFGAEGVSFLSVSEGKDSARGRLVDICHEALIRSWKDLGDLEDGWLIREFRNGLVWRAMLVQADSFERDPRNVLSPVTTGERQAWLTRRNEAWAERYGGGWLRVQSLIDASVAERERGEREQLERDRLEAERAEQALCERARVEREQLESQRREARSRLMRRWVAALGCLVVVLCAALYVAYQQLQESQVQFASAAATRGLNESLQSQLDATLLRNQALEEALKMSASTLTEAGSNLQSAVQGGDVKPAWRGRLDAAASALDSQADRIKDVVDELARPVAPSAVPAAPRLYVHVPRDDKAEVNVGQLTLSLGALVVASRSVNVVGIERVAAYPSNAELRCFDSRECSDLGRGLVEAINKRLLKPEVRLVDLSDRYGGKGLRANHFELWFPQGDIVRKAASGVGAYNVDFFYCEATRARSEPLARAALALKSVGDSGNWRVRMLTESVNKQSGYGIAGNVIRFTAPEEQPVADALAGLLKTQGVNVSLKAIAYPTPGLVSVFFCE